MSEPIVFISHFRIKEGKLDDLKGHSQMTTEHIKANIPGTVVFLQYFNEPETELSILHVFPDADSYDRHVEGVIERAKAGFEFLEPTHRELYGAPSNQALAMTRPPQGSGVEFNHMPQLNAGYIRFNPE